MAKYLLFLSLLVSQCCIGQSNNWVVQDSSEAYILANIIKSVTDSFPAKKVIYIDIDFKTKNSQQKKYRNNHDTVDSSFTFLCALLKKDTFHRFIFKAVNGKMSLYYFLYNNLNYTDSATHKTYESLYIRIDPPIDSWDIFLFLRRPF